jgi:two-component system OmpR family sensor kinase
MRRFVADASHELRTPLTTIRGFAELYRQGAATDVDGVMNRIEGEARRMGVLVEDLLMLARLDQQRPLSMAPVDVLAVVTEAVQAARVTSPDWPIVLEVDLAAGPPVVLGDTTRLRQVLDNLLANAIRHSGDGARVTAGVRTPGDGTAVVTVVDTGVGMHADTVQRVFERFYRADESRSRDAGGTGLGLAIVRSLVVAHGGTVAVESELGVGTTFTVTLPLGS